MNKIPWLTIVSDMADNSGSNEISLFSYDFLTGIKTEVHLHHLDVLAVSPTPTNYSLPRILLSTSCASASHDPRSS